MRRARHCSANPRVEDIVVARCARRFFLAVTVGGLLYAGAARAAKQPPGKPLNLNIATADQLADLPGIGPKTAQAIVEFREKSGPFRQIDDLLAIRGISRRKLAAIRPFVTVGPSPP
jgi:competence ComEA-like helix-hairpin-helix protein